MYSAGDTEEPWDIPTCCIARYNPIETEWQKRKFPNTTLRDLCLFPLVGPIIRRKSRRSHSGNRQQYTRHKHHSALVKLLKRYWGGRRVSIVGGLAKTLYASRPWNQIPTNCVIIAGPVSTTPSPRSGLARPGEIFAQHTIDLPLFQPRGIDHDWGIVPRRFGGSL